jgi:hypoxanthine phosphoribosyltransferase
MMNDLKEILFDEAQIKECVERLGKEISRDYAGKDLLLVGILKGAVVFFSDLIRAIDIPLCMDFMAISSYGSATRSTGVVRILKDLDKPIDGRHVIIVEDIIDSGMSLAFLKQALIARGAASMKVCVLLDKPDRRRTHVDVDYCGFVIPDEFVVGFGLDYAELYRNLPVIGILKPEIYTKD